MPRCSAASLLKSAIILVAALALAGCTEETPNPEGSSPAARQKPCYELGWKQCPDEPYPFNTPLPPAEPTAIDGTYTRHIGESLAWAPGKCRRCPPYRLQPGTATLVFDRGRYFVEQEPPGFRSSGHFWIDGGRIVLINDPSCTRFEGTYRWSVREGVLSLQAVDDECPFTRLRQRYLMARDWRVDDGAEGAAAAECSPPSEEAAVTGHWPIPPECEESA
jgi:hypothetical protein